MFGTYIDTYYYDKSIADGYTLKLMREPIETVYKEKIDSILDKLTGRVEVRKATLTRIRLLRMKLTSMPCSDYIIADFRQFRKRAADNSVGAMIVCKTNSGTRNVSLVARTLQPCGR